jgi:hypothetical protein
VGRPSRLPGSGEAANHAIRLIPRSGPELALFAGIDESGVGRMSADVLWWLGVFLSLGVVAGVAWIFDA